MIRLITAERIVLVIDGEAGVRPMSGASRRSMRAPIEWKVPIHIPDGSSPSKRATRDRISPAALLVKVTARMCAGCDAMVLDQPGDACGQHASLPGPSAREHQQWPFEVLDGLSLGRVQTRRRAWCARE